MKSVVEVGAGSVSRLDTLSDQQRDANFRRYFPEIQQALTSGLGGLGFKVSVDSEDSAAWVDLQHKMIHVPHIGEGNLEKLKIARGYIDHELGHVRYTTRSSVRGPLDEPLFKPLANLMEDIHVDAKTISQYPGCRVNLDNLYGIVKEASEMPDDTPAELKDLQDFFVTVYGINALDLPGELKAGNMFEPLMKKYRYIGLKDSGAARSKAAELARDMRQILKDWQPPTPPPSEKSGDGEPDPDSKEKSDKIDKDKKGDKDGKETDEKSKDGAGKDSDETEKSDKKDENEEDDQEKKDPKEKKDKKDKKDSKEDKPKKDKKEPKEKKPKKEKEESEDSDESEFDDEFEDEDDEDSEENDSDDLDEGDEDSDSDEDSKESDEDGEGNEDGEESDDDSDSDSDSDGDADGDGDGDPDDSDDSDGDSDSDGDGESDSDASGEPNPDGSDEAGTHESPDEVKPMAPPVKKMTPEELSKRLTEVEFNMSEFAQKELKGEKTVTSQYTIYSKDDMEIIPNAVTKETYLYDALMKQTARTQGHMMAQMIRMYKQERPLPMKRQLKGSVDTSSLCRPFIGAKDIFVKKVRQTAYNIAYTLLVDLSGSMTCGKLESAMQAAIVFSKCLEALHIPNEILGFTTEGYSSPFKTGCIRTIPLRHYVFKSFNEKFNWITEGRLNWILDNQFKCNHNVDGEAVLWASNRLNGRKEHKKVLIVLSDGQPECGTIRENIKTHLIGVVKKLLKDGMVLIGVGIQTDAVAEFYPEYVVLRNINDLSKTVLAKIEKQLLK